jgi:hypothetical protein
VSAWTSQASAMPIGMVRFTDRIVVGAIYVFLVLLVAGATFAALIWLFGPLPAPVG